MFGHVVSVGGDCQPAHQIRRITGLHHAHLFDWLLVPADGVARLLDADFDGWLAPDTLFLEAAPYAHVRDARYGVRFLHDFALQPGFLAGLPPVRAKYEALVKRWRLLMASDAAVLFVWKGDEDAAAAERIAQALQRARGGRPSHLLALRSDIEEAPWRLPGISNRFLRQPEPYVWTGDDAAWDALFEVGPR
ncbi:MAG TPA: DUF1796 family putative cysteine peptidase [Burkholderiaceae bacterium]|nr:DUF1796 family putative cysteine peptidase [Burkholderiaceae bacterium]